MQATIAERDDALRCRSRRAISRAVIAQEIDGLAHVADRVGQSSCRLRGQMRPARRGPFAFEQRRRPGRERPRARAGARRAPVRPARDARGAGRRDVGRIASTIAPTIRAVSAGLTDRPRAGGRIGGRVRRRSASPRSASAPSLAEIEARRIRALAARTYRRGKAMRGCGAPTGSSARVASTGSSISASTGTFGSAMRLTNEVLAPFSSKRRTR